MDLIIWGGPVSASNISAVQWHRPTTVLTLNEGIGGIGSGAFAALGASLGPRPIQTLLARHNLPTPDRIALCGFSAFHGLAEAILRSEDASMVNAFAAFDAYFTGPGREVKPGYLAFINRAVAGDALAVVTTSANGGTLPSGGSYPPGDESFAVLAAQLDLGSVPAPSGVPAPVATEGAGNFIWADYMLTVPHAGHVHQLAVPWLEATVAPYLAGEKPDLATASGPSSALWRVAKAGALTLIVGGLGYVAYEVSRGSRSGRLSNPGTPGSCDEAP